MEFSPELHAPVREHTDSEQQERQEQAKNLLENLRSEADRLVSLLNMDTSKEEMHLPGYDAERQKELIRELGRVLALMQNKGGVVETTRVPQPESLPERNEFARSPLEYDQEVNTLMQGAAELELYFDQLNERGMLDTAVLDDLHGELDRFQEQLQELDETTENPTLSPKRRALMILINSIRRRYPRNMHEQKSATLSSVRDLYRTVKASYASISHQLGEDERRSFRVRIAQLSAVVRHAEDAEYRRLFTRPTAVREIMARAQLVAPTLASAVSDVQKKRGILAALGDAFRLK